LDASISAGITFILWLVFEQSVCHACHFEAQDDKIVMLSRVEVQQKSAYALKIRSLAGTITACATPEVVMSMPADLAERVSEALGALYRRQSLLAWYRYAIYDALLADHHPAGYAARAWLDVLSAQHVLFCWQPYARRGWPTAWLQPADLLGLAEQTVQGLADPAVVQRQLTRAAALADLVGEPATSAEYPAWCVFEAARRALQSAWIAHTHAAGAAALNGRAADPGGLDDASWYAAIAVAGSLSYACGEPRVRPADADAQLRWTFFWEWWLREAIPQAALIARSSAVL
jgi:immunity protein Imm5 of predicted polymorphic toxin system